MVLEGFGMVWKGVGGVGRGGEWWVGVAIMVIHCFSLVFNGFNWFGKGLGWFGRVWDGLGGVGSGGEGW